MTGEAWLGLSVLLLGTAYIWHLFALHGRGEDE